jgi:putative transposase
MAATASIDAIEWLRKQVEAAPDGLRKMLTEMVNVLMNAEVDAVCGAGYGERTDDRLNSRNGYRSRPWDTRVGTIDLQIPKLRQGTYFPGWLLEPRRRAEKALTAVVAEAYLQGVSTRRVEDLSQSLGVEKLSKSQVSVLSKELDGVVKSFRERPLTGTFKYVWLDALVLKCREGGRIVNVACLVGVGVNDDGRREILGLEVVTAEDGAGWLAFLRSLRARGLKGVELVISDAHPGLKDAIASVLRGASWQRCRTHFIRNLLTRVPKAAHGIVGRTCERSSHSPMPNRSARSTPAPSSICTAALERQPSCSRTPRRSCSRLPDSRRSTGARSGRTTRRSGSTARSVGARTSSGSSRIARPSSASSAPCSARSTTTGPSSADT